MLGYLAPDVCPGKTVPFIDRFQENPYSACASFCTHETGVKLRYLQLGDDFREANAKSSKGDRSHVLVGMFPGRLRLKWASGSGQFMPKPTRQISLFATMVITRKPRSSIGFHK